MQNDIVINASIEQNKNISASIENNQNLNALSTQRGPQGIQGKDGEAATIELGTVSTGEPGTDVIITNSGTSSAAIFNFTIPRGENGQDGADGKDGKDGTNATITGATASITNTVGVPSVIVTSGGTSEERSFDFAFENLKGNTGETGNGIASISLISTVGLEKTYRITYTDGSYYDFVITDGASGATTWGGITGVLSNQTDLSNELNDLQNQIDAIVSSSDVFDIVGTYAELQAYDITTVPVNDVIKVLVDSTHDNAATYYRCVEVGGVKSWLYIGSEGAYYTKGEADSKFALITDLPDIATTSVVGLVKPDGDSILIAANGVISSTKGTVTSVNNVSPDSNGNVEIPSRNIGEIVASTIPLTDAGLHLLDGSLLQYGSYQAFVDYIADLYNSGNYSSMFTTESAWQTSVTNYGVCGKFVYDSVNNTVRLPKITGIMEGTTDLTTLLDLVEAGLPSIEHTHSYGYYNRNSQVGASGSARYTVASWASNTTDINSTVSPIYGRSSTVQPQTIKVLYYIVVANSQKTDIQVDIDEIATDLNGKADLDLSNVPSSKAILEESYTSGNSWYRIYSDGWCEQGGYSSDNVANATINLLKSYANTYYAVSFTSTSSRLYELNSRSTSYFIFNYGTIGGSGAMSFYWEAKGYIR